MHEFLVNLLIGIIGGIFSSVIVSRVFLILQEFQTQLDVLRKNLYCLGSIAAFFDSVEIILKNAYDTELEIKKSPNYAETHNLAEMEPTIERLLQKILLNSIDNIDKFDDKLTFKEKKLSTLHKDTIETTKQFKDITEFNFDSIDKSKKQIAELKNRYDKCFRGKSTTFLSLIFKDKAMLFLCYIFLLICIFTFLTK